MHLRKNLLTLLLAALLTLGAVACGDGGGAPEEATPEGATPDEATPEGATPDEATPEGAATPS
jgi:hypothetical protein